MDTAITVVIVVVGLVVATVATILAGMGVEIVKNERLAKKVTHNGDEVTPPEQPHH